MSRRHSAASDAYRAPADIDELEAKLVLLGPPDAGKSSIAIRYTKGLFRDSSAPTIGASFFQKGLQLHGAKIRLSIWDTAGQERFRAMGPMYYRNAKAAVIVVDISNPHFKPRPVILKWAKAVRAIAGNNIALAVAANKCDLKPSKKVAVSRGASSTTSTAAAGASSGVSGAGRASESGAGAGRRFGEDRSNTDAPAKAKARRKSSSSSASAANPAFAKYEARLMAASEAAAEVGANLYECSAKSNVSVSQIFSDVARALLIEWKTQEERRKRDRRRDSAGAEFGGGRRQGAGKVGLFKRHNSLGEGPGARPAGGNCAC